MPAIKCQEGESVAAQSRMNYQYYGPRFLLQLWYRVSPMGHSLHSSKVGYIRIYIGDLVQGLFRGMLGV